MDTGVNKRAAKLRKIAAPLPKRISDLRAPRLDNTPKRQLQRRSLEIEANLQERIQRACLLLAAGHESGTLSAGLASITTKNELARMLVTKLDHPNGMYSLCETNEYHDNTPLAQELRVFLATGETDIQRQEREKREAELRRRELEQKYAGQGEFYPTPPELADRVVELANIPPSVPFSGCRVLEPSAGSGRLLDSVILRTKNVVAVEINPALANDLRARYRMARVYNGDFLEMTPFQLGGDFRRIVMNPPFNGGMDIEHVRHAMKFLAPGGLLVSIVANGPRQQEKLQPLASQWIDLPTGSFKCTGTGVNAAICVIKGM